MSTVTPTHNVKSFYAKNTNHPFTFSTTLKILMHQYEHCNVLSFGHLPNSYILHMFKGLNTWFYL